MPNHLFAFLNGVHFIRPFILFKGKTNLMPWRYTYLYSLFAYTVESPNSKMSSKKTFNIKEILWDQLVYYIITGWKDEICQPLNSILTFQQEMSYFFIWCHALFCLYHCFLFKTPCFFEGCCFQFWLSLWQQVWLIKSVESAFQDNRSTVFFPGNQIFFYFAIM